MELLIYKLFLRKKPKKNCVVREDIIKIKLIYSLIMKDKIVFCFFGVIAHSF